MIDPNLYLAVFSQTTRGREQLLFCGQPFVYEKCVILPDGTEKKLWRCNQWWNQKCRARVYTIDDVITPLNKYHTHEDIVKRKKRVAKKKLLKTENSITNDSDQFESVFMEFNEEN